MTIEEAAVKAWEHYLSLRDLWLDAREAVAKAPRVERRALREVEAVRKRAAALARCEAVRLMERKV